MDRDNLILVEFYGLGRSFFKINDIKFSRFFNFNDLAFYQFRRPHFLDLVIFIFSIAVTLFGNQLFNTKIKLRRLLCHF